MSDDIYWLAKAVRQQQAMLRKLVRRAAVDMPDREELNRDLDVINACLAHIDTHVERG